MVTLSEIEQAQRVLQNVADRTNLILSHSFSRMLGGQIYLKPEMFQRTGSFKLRGAYNKIAALSPQQKQLGVVTASAGNHAQGVAVAAAQAGIPAVVVMPESAPRAKAEATRDYGAEVILYGPAYNDAYEYALTLARDRCLTMVPAFDDPQVVAGQGTIGLEVLDDLPEVDDVIVPVGGGGLLSGVAIAVKARKPAVRVIGVQAAGAAALVSSLKVGNPVTLPTVQTIADGIAVKRPGDLPFQIIQQYVDDVVTVRDEDILRAIVLLVERAKLVTEGAGAAPLAALLSGAVAARNRHVVLILSGGNIDIKRIGRVLYRGLLPDRLFRQLALAMSGTAAPSLALRAQRSDAEQTTGGNA